MQKEEIVIDTDNPQESVEKIQKAIDEFVLIIQKQEKELKRNVETMDNSAKEIQALLGHVTGLANIIKGVYRVVQSKHELWHGDKEMEELNKNLATFVVSSDAIKLGVISKKLEEENNEHAE